MCCFSTGLHTVVAEPTFASVFCSLSLESEVLTAIVVYVISLMMTIYTSLFSWVQFSHSVVPNSLQLHRLQHASPSPTPRAYSNSCLLSQWCQPTVSSSVVPFSSHLQSFPGSGSFFMNQVFASDGQSIGASASTSVLPTGLISFRMDWLDLQDSQESSPTPQLKVSGLQCSALFIVQFSHP